MLGITNTTGRHYDAARAEFEEAARFEEGREAARNWLEHLDALEAG